MIIVCHALTNVSIVKNSDAGDAQRDMQKKVFPMHAMVTAVKKKKKKIPTDLMCCHDILQALMPTTIAQQQMTSLRCPLALMKSTTSSVRSSFFQLNASSRAAHFTRSRSGTSFFSRITQTKVKKTLSHEMNTMVSIACLFGRLVGSRKQATAMERCGPRSRSRASRESAIVSPLTLLHRPVSNFKNACSVSRASESCGRTSCALNCRPSSRTKTNCTTKNNTTRTVIVFEFFTSKVLLSLAHTPSPRLHISAAATMTNFFFGIIAAGSYSTSSTLRFGWMSCATNRLPCSPVGFRTST